MLNCRIQFGITLLLQIFGPTIYQNTPTQPTEEFMSQALPLPSQFVAMPQTITPAGIELNPSTAPIDEPVKDDEKLI